MLVIYIFTSFAIKKPTIEEMRQEQIKKVNNYLEVNKKEQARFEKIVDIYKLRVVE